MNIVLEQSAELMWKGMVSIFVVIAVIFVVTFLMTKIKGKKGNGDDAGN